MSSRYGDYFSNTSWGPGLPCGAGWLAETAVLSLLEELWFLAHFCFGWGVSEEECPCSVL